MNRSNRSSSAQNNIAKHVIPLLAQGLKADAGIAKNVLLQYATFADDRDEKEVERAKLINSPYFVPMQSIDDSLMADMTKVENMQSRSNFVGLENIKNAPQGSIMIVPVRGVMRRETPYWGDGYMTGTRQLEQLFQAVERMPNIGGIVIELNSPGGEASGNQSLARCIKQCSKPVLVSFEGMASAAVESFIGADEIYALEDDSYFGSIGTYTSITDCSKFWEESGIKMIEIYAEQSTEKNKEYREAIAGNPQPMIDRLTKSTEFFIKDVKNTRPEIVDDGLIFKGKLYNAKEAKKIKAIDGIKPLSYVISRAATLARKKARNNNSSTKKVEMSKEVANKGTENEKASTWFDSVKSFFAPGKTDKEAGEQLAKALEIASKTNQDLETQKAEISSKLDETEKSLKAAQEKNDSLKKELDSLKLQMEKTTTEMDSLKSDFAHLEKVEKVSEGDEDFKTVESLVADYNKVVKHNKEIAPASPGGTPQAQQEKNNTVTRIKIGGGDAKTIDDYYREVEERAEAAKKKK